MLNGSTYREVYRNFKWQIPPVYNIGVDVCDKWADDKDKPALIYVSPDEKEQRYTFRELKKLSDKLANALRAHGIKRLDRVGILLPQRPETLISHIATYKLGAIALPLLTLFGPMAIEFRLQDSDAKAVITDRANWPKIMEIREHLPDLQLIMVIDSECPDEVPDFWQSIQAGSERFEPVMTRPDDPALIIYTSGTTGQPKGTLHAHRLLLGILPGFEFFHNLFPQPQDLMYTPLDWAYIGGSYDALFPSLHHGVPVLAYRPPKFDPEKAFYMMEKYRVRNLMAVPTVLRMMMNAVPDPQACYKIDLRSVTAGGETLGEELSEWSKSALKAELNEQYGQTECDLVIGFCSAVMPIVQGAIGKAVPGHTVEIIDKNGVIAKPGEVGEIAVKRPDPVMFIEYWNNPQATAEKYTGDWMRTGDFGKKDSDGHFWFTGREDDLIESGGYRIGPGEVEECLMSHESVALVCVLGVPDKVRGQIVKAFITPKKGVVPDKTLEDNIRAYVKGKLEAHAYPREIQFMDKMPMTKTGKIRKDKLK
ncbi:AMP-binding protein [Desulfococcaceae bacterium HSG7]|nr:AMP-binding protein [Desulfococcaceae bacterium HSG7]